MTLRTMARRLGAALMAVCCVLPLLAVQATPAAAATTMTFSGRGYGHGRGMGQYGAYGYAKDHGWSSTQILDHYYGGTRSAQASTAANAPTLPYRRIRLERMANKVTTVAIVNGSLSLTPNSGSISLPANTKAVKIFRSSAATNAPLMYSTGSSCTGAFSDWVQTSATIIDVGKNRSDTADRNDLIHVCPTAGASYDVTSNATVWYPGSIRAQSVAGKMETLNLTTVENQLRGIVPNEMPASWSAAALQAQSVAARSYSMSGDSRWGSHADTCDTIYCQVYAGWFSSRSTDTGNRTTHPNTDAAIAATSGVVRLHNSNNRIASTEFSSSTGGHTAGGTYPAVADAGDSISPHATWTVTVSVAPLEAAYRPGKQLRSIEVTKRNGLGTGGGRVVTANLHFSDGYVATGVSGNTIRSKLGLKSDWFFTGCEPQSRFIEAAYRLFVKRSASASDVDYWCASVRNGERTHLTSALSVSDEWAGTEVDNLYRKILGRSADANGRAYWLARIRSGLHVEEIAIYFYGGAEYFSRSGKTNAGFVDRLYRDLLGRPSDSGRNYWIGMLDRGQMDRAGVAASFYASSESRRQRVTRLYATILGRGPDSSGLAYWAGVLPEIGDVTLAAYLASSQEYYNRTTR